MKRWIVVMALFVPLTYFIGQAQTKANTVSFGREEPRSLSTLPRMTQKTDPSGNSGVLIACGVIEKVPFAYPAIHTVR